MKSEAYATKSAFKTKAFCSTDYVDTHKVDMKLHRMKLEIFLRSSVELGSNFQRLYFKSWAIVSCKRMRLEMSY